MNNTSSLSKISKTGNLDTDLILRQNKIKLIARFMEGKSTNQGLKQD